MKVTSPPFVRDDVKLVDRACTHDRPSRNTPLLMTVVRNDETRPGVSAPLAIVLRTFIFSVRALRERSFLERESFQGL